jgi:small-conductance mechanosensitive channel
MTLQAWDPYLSLLAAMLLALLAQALAFAIVRDRKGQSPLRNIVLDTLRGPARLAAVLLGAVVMLETVRFPNAPHGLMKEVAILAFIATIAWVVIALLRVGSEVAAARYQTAGADDLLVRKLRTRVDVVGKVVGVLVVILAIGAMLMTLPGVRALGTSILASAGIVGIVAGLAAQPLLTNLFAGLQIAITQPLRLNDVVVVSAPTSSSAYWGQIEEITAAYVVVRVWDLRRLIVPLAYILQQPFENWTYKTSDLLGYVTIYADYRVDVDAVRQELQRILHASADWDRKVWNLQVTTVSPETIGMRALFSARDSTHRWNLIVMVQEQLVRYLQERYPEHLPRMRVEVIPPDDSAEKPGQTVDEPRTTGGGGH